jgi:hypothetical protein
MTTKLKRLAIMIMTVLLTLSLSSCGKVFHKLDSRSFKALRQDLNKYLLAKHEFEIPEFHDSNVNKEKYKHFQTSETAHAVKLQGIVDKNAHESVIVSLPMERYHDTAAIEEFLGIMASVINRFAGVDYIEPIGNGLIRNGATNEDNNYHCDMTVGDYLYTFGISEQTGFTFTVESTT